MSNVWGRGIRVSIFGESHGKAIGIIIDGLPPGEDIDLDEINFYMQKRSPGRDQLTTPRRERDEVEILSGLFNGKTTGAPLCGMIRNSDTRSSDYNSDLPRPGTADLTAYIKYHGYNDYRGGGHFSGRLTAPLTFAGSIARQILKRDNISIGAHILKISDVLDDRFNSISHELLEDLTKSSFPLLNKSLEGDMKASILGAKEDSDSLGGVIECAAIGIPPGLGSPFFDSMESSISSMMFSIPGVKAIEFGAGFDIASMRGSEANDEIYLENGSFYTKTNHSGGINGGITNGMPIVFRLAFRPTPSIKKTQNTVNLKTMTDSEISIQGRHDPCIVPRAVVVVESALALCILDSKLSDRW
ncbi:MAG: chorismate synthase [Clostridiales bacterium]|nr:chorismate synthase [Clostridiales bacterium]